MLSEIEIVSYSKEHISEIRKLWEAQYQVELSTTAVLPNTWGSWKREVEAFLRKQSGSKHFAVAKRGGEVVGYMLFQAFSFHGEATAFCPIIGHAEKEEIRREVLERLYQDLSEGIISHAITYFAHDKNLEETVFTLGFGMIVIDAFRDIDTLRPSTLCATIVQSTQDNLYALKALGEESRDYYVRAPIFLTRDSESQEYYRDLLSSKEMAIYLAFTENEPVGFMSTRRNKELSFLDLCDTDTALIDEIGA
jgi:hypothetical protein